MSFAEVFRELRRARGVTLRDLGARAGLHASYLSRLEHGERGVPAVEVVRAIAAGLDVSAGERDALLQAAGCLLPAAASAAPLDPEVAGVARVLASADPAAAQRFRAVLRLLLEQWEDTLPPA